MKKIIILLVSVLFFSSCAAQGYKDQRGIVRMLYGGDTLSMMFSGDTNLFTGNLQYFKLDGGIILDSFKLGSVWYSSLLTPPSSVDLSDATGGALLFELNDTIGWHSGLGALNGKIFSLGIESTSTTGNLLETSADTNIMRNTATNGVNLLEATATGGTNRMSAKYRNEFWADDTMRIYIDADGLHGYSIPESPTEAELLDNIDNNKVLMRIGDSVGNSEMIISPGNYFQPQADIYNISNLGPRIKTGVHTYSDYVPAYTFDGNDSSGWRGGATYSGIWYAQSKGSKLITYTPDSIYFHVPIKGNHGITGGTGGQDFSYLPDGAVPFEAGDTLSGSANFNFNPATGLLSVLGVSVYNHSDGDYSFNTYVDSSGTGYYCTLDNEGIGMHIINEGPGVALKLQNNSSSPGDLIQIYEESTLKLKVDSTGQLFLHDSLKVPYLATDCEGWLLKTVTEGVGYDTISEGATKGLTDPLRPLAEVMTDTIDGEILWPYMTRKGEMDSTRTIKGLRPSEIFYLLQYAVEQDRRYILQLQEENETLKNRMNNLEDRIKILEKLAAQ